MEFLPVFLQLKGQGALVVGGEESALSKLQLLSQAGATITLVAQRLHPQVEAWLAQQTGVNWQQRGFQGQDVAQKKLVFIASEDEALTQEVYAAAQAQGIPVNAIDQPEHCSFIMPSIIDRSPLVIAVSSSGACPRLSRMVRAQLERLFPHQYGRLAALMAQMRDETKHLLGSAEERRRFWDKIFASPLIEMFLSGQEERAKQALWAEVKAPKLEAKAYGQVALVGAGPGDPDLLTIRALRLIQNADVLVYDRLVNPAILDFARREATRIYVGKQASRHVVPQEGINQLLVDLAREGKLVVRLKGGDPFIFGRGGEELDRLKEFGVDFQVVPGITAASGCGAYAGIPLTHRDHAQSLRLITGHLKEGDLDLDWASLAKPGQTLVFYMGLATAPIIAQRLQAQGLPASYPVALVEKGTLAGQKTHLTTLAGLPALAARPDIEPPALLIIGTVVNLHQQLRWFNPQAESTS